MRLLVSFFLVLLALPAAAEQQQLVETVDSDYAGVPVGLMLSEVQRGAAQPGTPEEEQIAEIIPIDDIIAAYNAGKYDLAFRHLSAILRGGQYPKADQLIGIMYRNGQGTEKNPQLALQHFQSAAETGLPLAQHYLASMLYTGEAGSADIVSALMWFNIAIQTYPAGLERDRATQDRDSAAEKATRRERERADALSREWLDKKGGRLNLLNYK